MCLYCILAKYQIAPLKAVVGVDWPMKAPFMHIQKPYLSSLSCHFVKKNVCELNSFMHMFNVTMLTLYRQSIIFPSKAVVGVDRPKKASSMHIQKPN